MGGRRGLVSVLLRPPCPPLAGRNEGPSDWSAASGHEIDLFFHNARVCVCVLLGWSRGVGRLRGGGGRRGLGRPVSSPAPRLLPAAPSRGAGRSLVPCEQARDTRDGGANAKKKPSETVGVIYRHTHSHMGLTAAAVPPSHHTRGHGHTHTPALPSPRGLEVPSYRALTGGRGGCGAAAIVLSEAEGPVRENGAGPEPGRREGSTQRGRPMGSAAPIIFRHQQRAAPCPDNRHGKGQSGLWLCPPPRRRLESGAQPSSAAPLVAVLGGSSWSRARALSILKGHGYPPLSCKKTARVQGEGSADAGSGRALSPRGGAGGRRGRGRGSPGASPR